MRGSFLLSLSLACAALVAPGPRARACDHSTLMAFQPDQGEVLLRKRLPSTEEVVRPMTVSETSAECPGDESDRACKERLTAAHTESAGPDQTVAVALEGPTSGIYALMKGSQGEVDGLFGDYAELADYFESPEAREQELVLVLAEPAIDRGKRKAIVKVTEEDRETEQRPPGLRILYRPVGTSLESLRTVQDAARAASIVVVSWQPQNDGVVALELRCLAD